MNKVDGGGQKKKKRPLVDLQSRMSVVFNSAEQIMLCMFVIDTVCVY